VTTLGQSLDPRHNSVNAIRLFFATSILFLHALPLGGYMDMPTFIFSDTIGTYMLAGFFAISGYMITASRLSSRSLGDYMWRRVLRIYPAWIASLVLVGFVLGPLSRRIEGKPGYEWSSGLSYVTDNFFFVLKQFDVVGTLDNVPVPEVWNFSAWTLFYEFTLWIGMGLLVTVVARRYLHWGMYLGLAVFTAIKVADKLLLSQSVQTFAATDKAARERAYEHASSFEKLLTIVEPLARLGIFFMAGAILYIHKDKIRMSPVVAAACAVICTVLALDGIGWFHVIGALPWAYLVMYLGCSKRLAGVNFPDDYSYGMYIYAFPVTQIAATIALDHSMPAVVFLPLCLLMTAPLAWLSWHYLEKPAMTLKRLTKGREKPIIGAS